LEIKVIDSLWILATYMEVRDELRHAEFHTVWMSISNEMVKG